jgi:EmrB/QacA subfamily drug resistance transporter
MSKKQSTLLLLGLLLGVLLEALDGTIVSTAMPKIVSDLDGVSLLSWVFSAYILTSTVSTPIYGKLSDMYGRMPFYLGGMSIFMLGSIACGAAQDMTQLIIFRGVQGLGAGAMMPLAIALAQTVFGPTERGKIQAAISGAFGISSVIGPTLGGLIVDNLSWRWVFYFSVPFGILSIVLLYFNLPEAGRRSFETSGKKSIDYRGALALIVGSAALMLGFQWGGDSTLGWTNWQTLLTFGIAILCLAGFILAEQRALDPIVPLKTFSNRTFTVGVLSSFLVGGAMMAIFSYLPLFMQGVLQVSATNSGTIITPAMLAMVVGVGVTGSTVGRKIQRYKWMAVAAGVIMLVAAALMMTLDMNSAQWTVIIYMILFGFGLGITYPLYSIIVSTSMERRFLGVSLSLLTFFRNMGSAVSVALLGSILVGQLKSEIPTQLALNVPANVVAKLPVQSLTEAGLNGLTNPMALAAMRRSFNAVDPSGQLFGQVVEALRAALSNATHVMFVGGTLIAVLALLVTFGLKNERLNLALLRQLQPVTPSELPAIAVEREEALVD